VTSIEHILTRAVSPSHVRMNDGGLTSPRSYGVYHIPSSADSTRSFRFGNHPVRQRELERDFGSCKLEYLFLDRADAEAVARALAGRS
jgi:hypothetical protein